MQKLLFHIVLLYILSSHSSAESNVILLGDSIHILDIVNQGRLLSNSKLECSLDNEISKFASDVSSQKYNNQNYNKCAIDLCGSPKQNKSIWVTDTNFSSNIPPILLKKVNLLSPRIKKMFEISARRQLELLTSAKKIIEDANFKKDGLSTEARMGLDFQVFGPYIKQVITPEASLGKKIQFVVNSEFLPPNEIRLAVRNYISKLNEYILTRFTSDMFANIYSEDDYKELFDRQLRKISDLIKKQDKKPSDTILELIERIEDYKKDEIKMSERLDLDYLLDDLNTMFINEYNISFRILPECTHIDCEKAYKQILKSSSLKNKIEALSNLLIDPETITLATNKCKAHILANEISSSNKKKAAETFKLALTKVQTKILPRFSSHSQKLLADYLMNKLTYTTEDYRRVGKKNLTIANFNKEEENFYAVQNINSQDTRQDTQVLTLNKILALNNSMNDQAIFEDVGGCEGMSGSNAWDFFLPISSINLNDPIMKPKNKDEKKLLAEIKKFGERDIVSISDFSCNHGEKGIHIITHELGHAIDSVFKKGNLSKESAALYSKMESCVSSKYVSNFKTRKFLVRDDNGNQFTAEDIADYMSEITNDESKTIHFCSLLKPGLLSDSYTDLSFINSKDKHSTPLTRVLQEAVQKGVPLPLSCTKLIKEEKPPVEFRKCI